MSEEQTMEIDGAAFDDFEGFIAHCNERLFDVGPWNGDLDVLNDLLHGGFGNRAEGVRVHWRNVAGSREALGHFAMAVWLRQNLKECHPSSRDDVQKRLARAENREGDTLFDLILEIFLVRRGDSGIEVVLEAV